MKHGGFCRQSSIMKKKFFLLATVFFLFFGLVPLALASGELQTTNKNGALYLTTQEISASSSAVATVSARTTSFFNIAETPIFIPTGFATSFGSVFNFALQVIIVVAVLLVFGSLIIGGIQWITSGGEKTKTEAARNRIISSIVGLIIVASSYAIFLLILHFLGFTDINDVINHVDPIDSTRVEISTSSSQLRQQELVK